MEIWRCVLSISEFQSSTVYILFRCLNLTQSLGKLRLESFVYIYIYRLYYSLYIYTVYIFYIPSNSHHQDSYMFSRKSLYYAFICDCLLAGWIDSTSICHTDGLEFSKPCLAPVAWGGHEPEGDVENSWVRKH